MTNKTPESLFCEALTTEGLERFDILHEAIKNMFIEENHADIDRMMLLALGTHNRGWIRTALITVKPVKSRVSEEIYERLVDYLIKDNKEREKEEERREEKFNRLQEKYNGWVEMLENAPGEAHETIRERALSSHYLQPIVESWRKKVEELEAKINEQSK